MTPDDIDVMARTIYGEARGETMAGKIAVAWVIRNRADKPNWWGSGISGVCKAPWQFSCWLENDPNRAKLLDVTVRDDVFRDCLMVTAGVLSGNFPDPTGGANHYHATSITPRWAAGQEPTARIHRHVFYKL